MLPAGQAVFVATAIALCSAGCSSTTPDAAAAHDARDASDLRDASNPGDASSLTDASDLPDASNLTDASDLTDARTDDDAAVDMLAPLPSAACTRDDDAIYPVGTTEGEISFAGGARTFRVHVPPGYDGSAARPLVLMLHGGGGSGRQFEEASSRFDSVADREQVIAVYPDGSGVLKTWNGGGCCGFAVTNDVDDVGFIDSLLDHLEAELCIDRRRVFASGMSNGAIMSHRLACELADRIAAIAPVAGTNMTDVCMPSRPVPVLQIHGSDDGHVPFAGGEGCGPAGVAFVSVPDTISDWRARNECTAAIDNAYLETELDLADADCEIAPHCAEGAQVALCTIVGGGHNWPGGEPPAGLVECPGNGTQSATFSASRAIWAFFAAHPMPMR